MDASHKEAEAMRNGILKETGSDGGVWVQLAECKD
jgi:hypothetical protein